MARRSALSAALLGLVLCLVASLPLRAGGKSDSEVKVTAVGSKVDAAGKQVVTVTLVHNKGWHTYANPVGNEDFDGNKTVVTVLSKGKAVTAKVAYPAGKVHKDTVVGDYKIYENKTEIQATVTRIQGDGPLEINVRIQACHDKGRCLVPATVKLSVP